VEKLAEPAKGVGTNHKLDEEPRCDESATEKEKLACENAPSCFPSVHVGMP